MQGAGGLWGTRGVQPWSGGLARPSLRPSPAPPRSFWWHTCGSPSPSTPRPASSSSASTASLTRWAPLVHLCAGRCLSKPPPPAQVSSQESGIWAPGWQWVPEEGGGLEVLRVKAPQSGPSLWVTCPLPSNALSASLHFLTWPVSHLYPPPSPSSGMWLWILPSSPHSFPPALLPHGALHPPSALLGSHSYPPLSWV